MSTPSKLTKKHQQGLLGPDVAAEPAKGGGPSQGERTGERGGRVCFMKAYRDIRLPGTQAKTT